MSVFKPGDVVYHPIYGKATVSLVTEGRPANDKHFRIPAQVSAYPQEGTTVKSFCCPEDMLSFSPWPKANHERPLEDGLYLVTYGSSIQFLGVYKHSTWHWANGGIEDWKGRACSTQSAVTIVKFLHALPKN